MGATAVFCVEADFSSSKPAFEWGVQHLLGPDDQLHVVTVLPAIDFTITPGGPFASSAAHVISEQWDRERRRNQLQAAETLKDAVEIVRGLGVSLRGLHTHALPESGGSAAIGSQLVKYAAEQHANLVVLGSRGQGALKRNLMSVVGLGSVSDYVVHNIHCPVMVLRQGCLQDDQGSPQPDQSAPTQALAAGSEGPARRKICVSLDRSDHSKAMLEWAMEHFFNETDEIHLVSVATPVHYPVLDDATGAAVCTVEAESFEAAKKEAVSYAEETAREAVKSLKAHSVGFPSSPWDLPSFLRRCTAVSSLQ